ncbi:MAG TPA: hypothetical protein VMZ51_08165 [Acidimicrobiales bacterium]|nr:hypothetical protein [Acidimicrobiales bacterium]
MRSGPTAPSLTERRWDRDLPAYARLRQQGLQPEGIDGCAALETRAQSRVEIETNQIIEDRSVRELANDIHTVTDGGRNLGELTL